MDYRKITTTDIALEKKLLKAYQAALETMPQGRLSAKRVKGTIHYYHVDEKTGKQTYIPKSQTELIYQLKQKRFMKKAVKVIENNINVQEKILKKYKPYDYHSLKKMLPPSDSDNLLDEYESKVFPDLHKWENSPYRKNPYKPEYLRFKTSFGLMVRSKGEMFIAELLHNYNIPFHYDAAIKLKDEFGEEKTRYVDFLIRFPDGGFLVWEHMGLFGKEDYQEDQFVKLREYFQNGIFMPNNLIVTMDGPNGEFDNHAVECMIKGQILSRLA